MPSRRWRYAGEYEKVLAICHELHRSNIIPVAPYLISLQYLNDAVVEDRQLGIQANIECLKRGFIDELWLFGERISAGMREEIKLACALGIPVVPKTEVMKMEYATLLNTL